jgi:hypothetical protein
LDKSKKKGVAEMLPLFFIQNHENKKALLNDQQGSM